MIPPVPGRMFTVTPAEPSDQARLFEVWESSVRATHHFLSEADLQFLIPLAKRWLAGFTPVYCLRDPDGRVYAFVGVAGSNIDMLFVHADRRGTGAGRALVEYAVRELGADAVDVNEQNPGAVGFYEHLGFRTVGRSPLDSTGKPFPILHMRLRPAVLNKSGSP
jgi:putative acetyltransferase